MINHSASTVLLSIQLYKEGLLSILYSRRIVTTLLVMKCYFVSSLHLCSVQSHSLVFLPSFFVMYRIVDHFDKILSRVF